MSSDEHTIISPAIMYWGTPVVLITSVNEDGTSNIAPISSAWWLGHSCVLGLGAACKTTQNILRTKECVLNLASDSMGESVNKLALTTGLDRMPEFRVAGGYAFVKDKWGRAGFHRQPSSFVAPPRIAECPVQMECRVLQISELSKDLPDRSGLLLAIEVRVLRTHIVRSLRMEGYANRVDPDKWRPLIMSFREFYGLRDGKVFGSALGKGSEECYRVFTKSDVVKLPGDDDEEIAAAEGNA